MQIENVMSREVKTSHRDERDGGLKTNARAVLSNEHQRQIACVETDGGMRQCVKLRLGKNVKQQREF